LQSCPSGYNPKSNSNSIICQNQVCTTDQCCDKTCNGYQCPPYRLLKSTAVNSVCPSDAGCTDDFCCRPTCQSYTCSQSGYQLIPSPEQHLCADNGCTSNECCQPTCENYPCTGGYTVKAGVIPCGSNGCDLATCCKQNTCPANFDCPAGYINNPGAPCSGVACSQQECCQYQNGNCNAWQPFMCPANQHLKQNPSCMQSPCKPSDCCCACNYCSDFTGCPSSGSTLLRYVNCADQACTTAKCCQSSCIGYACPNGYHALDDPASIPCSSPYTCTLNECCAKGAY